MFFEQTTHVCLLWLFLSTYRVSKYGDLFSPSEQDIYRMMTKLWCVIENLVVSFRLPYHLFEMFLSILPLLLSLQLFDVVNHSIDQSIHWSIDWSIVKRLGLHLGLVAHQALNLVVLIYTPGWRKAQNFEWSILSV